MQTGIAVRDTDQKDGNVMNINPNVGSAHNPSGASPTPQPGLCPRHPRQGHGPWTRFLGNGEAARSVFLSPYSVGATAGIERRCRPP